MRPLPVIIAPTFPSRIFGITYNDQMIFAVSKAK